MGPGRRPPSVWCAGDSDGRRRCSSEPWLGSSCGEVGPWTRKVTSRSRMGVGISCITLVGGAGVRSWFEKTIAFEGVNSNAGVRVPHANNLQIPLDLD